MLNACVLTATMLLAQPTGTPATGAEPAKTEKKPVEPKPVNAPQTLDELLGLKPAPAAPASTPGTQSPPPTPASGARAPVAAPDPNKADLDRILNAAEMGDAFKQAIALMGDASGRLSSHADPGLDTQRIQADVIRRLDQLLASLDQQQQQQQQQQGQGQPQDQQQQDAPGRPQQQQGQQQQAQGGDGNRTDMGPPRQDGTLKSEIESARAAWGALPARVRDMLLQGSSDRFSARYKTLTEEYYKRLAEESGK